MATFTRRCLYGLAKLKDYIANAISAHNADRASHNEGFDHSVTVYCNSTGSSGTEKGFIIRNTATGLTTANTAVGYIGFAVDGGNACIIDCDYVYNSESGQYSGSIDFQMYTGGGNDTTTITIGYDSVNFHNSTLLNVKLDGAISPVIYDKLTANRALISDEDGDISVSDDPIVTATELGYLSGCEDNIQDQLDGKAFTDHTHDEYALKTTVDDINNNYLRATKHVLEKNSWVEDSTTGFFTYTFNTNNFSSLHIFKNESGGSILVDESVEVHIVGSTNVDKTDRSIKLVAPERFDGYALTLG